MAQVSKELANKLVLIAKRQLQASRRFRQRRFEDIRKNEDLYMDKPRPALPGRFNVPIDSVIIQGFTNTLLSKIDNPPVISYEPVETRNLFGARKVSAAWKIDSAPDKGMWGQKDLEGKKFNILSGRTVFKYFSDFSGRKYTSNLEVIDHYDFYPEPQGGRYLENHLFLYQNNIFKSKFHLTEGIKAGVYDKDQVRKLALADLDAEHKKVEGFEIDSKNQRFHSIGLDPETNNYVGENLFRLVEGGLTFEGKRYWMLFHEETGIWVRCEPLKDVFESGLWPFVGWAYDVDSVNYWSKSPVDAIRPIAEAARIIFNQTLDNIQRRNWDMVAYDKNIFPNPEQFKYRPYGLIKANVKPGQNIANGIYTFQTPDTGQITINMLEYIKAFMGTETGISAATQGTSEDDKVGIYFGNLQQVADRLGLTNKLYSQCWTDLGVRYDWGLYENMPEDFMVEFIGLEGKEWDELRKEDVEPDFKTIVVGGNAEQLLSEVKTRNKNDALTRALNAGLSTIANPRVLYEEMLRAGDWEESQIRALLDNTSDASQELIARADKAIFDIIRGKEAKPYRGATTHFIQRIVDYAMDNVHDKNPQKDQVIFGKLMVYAQGHIEFAKQNMARKIVLEQNKIVEGGSEVAGRGTPVPEKVEPAGDNINIGSEVVEQGLPIGAR